MLQTFVLLAAGISQMTFAQQSDRSLGTQCIESLQIPRYPNVARLARISGTVQARVLVDAGAAKTIDIDEAANLLLRTAVKEALLASSFSVRCNATSLELVFTFVIGGEPVVGQDSGQVTFRWPNRFTITVRPRVPNAEIEKLEVAPSPR